MTDFALKTDFVPRGAVLLVRPSGLVQAWHGSTDADRGAALLAAMDAIGASDVLRLGPGTFDVGGAEIALPDGAALLGSGPGQTLIVGDTTSTLASTGDEATFADLAITVDNGAGLGSALQIGPGGTVRNCRLTSLSSALIGPDGGVARAYGCVFNGESSVAVAAAAGELELYDCLVHLRFSASVTSGIAVQTTTAGAIVRMFGGRIVVDQSLGRGALNSGGSIELLGTQVVNAGANSDLHGASAAIKVAGAVYNPAAVAGTITPLDGLSLRASLLGVDGAASGLDADLLDGQHGSYYTDAANLAAGTLALARLPAAAFAKGWTCWHDEAIVTAGNALSADTTGFSSQPFNHVVYQSAAANGDTFTHRVWLQAGTYTFTALGVKNANQGKIDWKLDGTTFISGQDWYAAALAVNQRQTGSVTVATAGHHVLSGVVNGKHASSTGFFVPLTKYWFRQASD